MDPLELHKDEELINQDEEKINQDKVTEVEKNDKKSTEPVAETQDSTTTETESTEQPKDTSALTRPELLRVLKDLLTKDVDKIKEEVETVKHSFYKRLKAETEENKKLFIENGGNPAEFVPEKDGLDDELKNLLNEYKTKRAALATKREVEKEQNLLEKQHILDRMKVLVESNDDVSSHINEFRDLQKKWKSIGQVPQQQVNVLWKLYSSYQDAFWDLIKINNELREYDFKKNLEAKTRLCEMAEQLGDEKDVISAFQQLQKLHDDWRDTGPVAREFREEIWLRFKEASSVINKKHQGHFEEIRKLEEENLAAKTDLCEKIEAYDVSGLKTYKEWDEATKTIISWQEEWRSIGFAPRKMNRKIFERYRAACDAFFNAKAIFYKASKQELSDNLDKKKQLCEFAESMKDSTEWKEVSEKFIQIQKEWKTIGPVPKKYSDEIWKRFITACDYFFEQKNKNTSGQRKEEQENLLKKKDLIDKINTLDTVEDKTPAEVLTMLREYIADWNEVGHVPFRDKDKIYKEYRTAIDKIFEKLHVDVNQRRLDTFKSNLKDMTTKGESKLYREREKLMRAYDHLKSEISTYENNIGFLSASNKKGNGLIQEMDRKIDALKEEAKLIEQKITLIDQNL